MENLHLHTGCAEKVTTMADTQYNVSHKTKPRSPEDASRNAGAWTISRTQWTCQSNKGTTTVVKNIIWVGTTIETKKNPKVYLSMPVPNQLREWCWKNPSPAVAPRKRIAQSGRLSPVINSTWSTGLTEESATCQSRSQNYSNARVGRLTPEAGIPRREKNPKDQTVHTRPF